jgi:hypothetical protein
MRLRLFSFCLLLGLFLAATSTVSAAPARSDLSFRLEREVVQVYWNADGSESLDYTLTFSNDPGAPMIDYVDIGMPNSHFDMDTVKADVTADGRSNFPVPASTSDYLGSGSGFAVHLLLPIYAGQSGTLHVSVGSVSQVLYKDSDDPDTYASAVFIPVYFDSKYVHGSTDLTVTFHLPPGVQPQEPRYHTPSANWPGLAEPVIGRDDQGNITYTWQSSSANASTKYTFGASFPKKYVPAETVRTKPLIDFGGVGSWWKNFGRWMSEYAGAVIAITCNVVPWAAIGIGIWIASIKEKKRKLQYLPPKITIEGHGVKRGLTAVEAGLLLQEPLDKIMTMILFGVVKKKAATVTNKDPLKVEAAVPLPKGLYDYETEFLAALANDKPAGRRKDLQEMTVNLVKSLSQKMKGFSRKETVVYYREIMQRAWQEIEKAGTPEVRSKLYEESLEWTMLDKNYERRTESVFSEPFLTPSWWGHYDPSYQPAASSHSASPKASTSGVRPALPGSALAASVVTGVQGLSTKVMGDVKAFTSGVSDKTNPAPISSSSGGGGSSGSHSSGSSHSSCACACACAGCACACAGGGR